jgi:hypothetical protein
MAGDCGELGGFRHLPLQRGAGKAHLALERLLRQRAPPLARRRHGTGKGKVGEIEQLAILDEQALHLRLEHTR